MDTPVARIIDANFNRSREAVRVMEDYARFVLDDPASCETLKRFRHDLSTCFRVLPATSLLSARDTPGDVGTDISTNTEKTRENSQAVCVAAAKRLPEALRTIEEYAKTFDGAWAVRIESLRYRSYELEPQLLLRGDRSSRMNRVRLYVLITASMCRNDWLQTAANAIAGGAGCVQLREKNLDDGELLARAKKLAGLCHERNVLFIVNDRPDIARLADADGVHLGQTDMTVADARRIIGPDRLIGLSTHNETQFEKALAAEPDYLAVGPMFPTTTKPQDHVPGPELLRLAVGRTERPVVCIGGITRERLPVLIDAGGRCICACSAIIGADNVQTAARGLLIETKAPSAKI